MAVWNDSATLGGGQGIQTGELSITENATADSGWYWGTSAVAGQEITDISTVRLAPGDSVTYKGSYDLVVNGDNLAAKVDVDGGAIDNDLGGKLTVSPIGQGSLTDITADQTVEAGATITFDPSATAGMNETINLTGITVTLEQTVPAANPAP